ncbi:S41 family peptidase [Undibacterium sp. Ren11W]|uniref:S41 family peptidase n=1 Tax=Undibacterium sp. Ren11W TaxID=3413045 RepID=UPI003BF2ACA2
MMPFSTFFASRYSSTAMLVFALLSATAPLTLNAQPAENPVLPKTAADWRHAAIIDIDAAYQLSMENHPGVYDTANPDFLKNLQAAKASGLALAVRVEDAAGYVAATQGFNVRIHDGHAGMSHNLDVSQLPAERWPGFITVWRGDALYVYAAEMGGPSVGAEVLACDGKPIKQIISTNVFGFQGRSDEAGHWWVRAPRVFLDRGNPFLALPRRCQFSLNGKSSQHSLVWKALSEQASKWRTESYNGEQLEVGMSEPRKKILWLAMPTFAPDEKQREAYRLMLKGLAEHRKNFLEADAVVIDLRQNQGGSSEWSQLFAEALWGKGRVDRRVAAYGAKTEVWWRASLGNTDYVAGLVEVLTQQKQIEGAQWARIQSEGMQAALARGDKFFVEAEQKALKQSTQEANADVFGDPPAFKVPLYVIVPGQCASACLDAIDVFSLFSNTKLIGAPSSADSTYMDVRTQRLASGLADVIIPNKVYVNRPRKNGQVYLPAIYVKDLQWSNANLLKAVEADLMQTKLQTKQQKNQ